MNHEPPAPEEQGQMTTTANDFERFALGGLEDAPAPEPTEEKALPKATGEKETITRTPVINITLSNGLLFRFLCLEAGLGYPPATHLAPHEIYLAYCRKLCETDPQLKSLPLEEARPQAQKHLAEMMPGLIFKAFAVSDFGRRFAPQVKQVDPLEVWTEEELTTWDKHIKFATGLDPYTGEPYGIGEITRYLVAHNFEPPADTKSPEYLDYWHTLKTDDTKVMWLQMTMNPRTLAKLATEEAKKTGEELLEALRGQATSTSRTTPYSPAPYYTFPTLKYAQGEFTLIQNQPMGMSHNPRKLTDIILECTSATILEIENLDIDVIRAIGNFWKRGINEFTLADVAREIEGKDAHTKIRKERLEKIKESIEKLRKNIIDIDFSHLRQLARKDKSIPQPIQAELDKIARKLSLTNKNILTLRYDLRPTPFGTKTGVYTILDTPPTLFAIALATGYTKEIPRAIVQAGAGQTYGEPISRGKGLSAPRKYNSNALRSKLSATLFTLLESRQAKEAQHKETPEYEISIEKLLEQSGLDPASIERHTMNQLINSIPGVIADTLKERGIIENCTLGKRATANGKQPRWKNEKVVCLLPPLPEEKKPKNRGNTTKKRSGK